mgnify:CR=1 FL=1
MYVSPNFKTKKELKLAIQSGKSVYVYQPNDMFNTPTKNLKGVCVEGPHFPQPHKWYGQVDTDADGKVVKVK